MSWKTARPIAPDQLPSETRFELMKDFIKKHKFCFLALAGSFILVLCMGLLVLGVMAENNQLRTDQIIKATRIQELKMELAECKQLNANATRLLKNETIVVRLK